MVKPLVSYPGRRSLAGTFYNMLHPGFGRQVGNGAGFYCKNLSTMRDFSAPRCRFQKHADKCIRILGSARAFQS